MKKALVLGVMALFAINMIANAQPGTRTAAPSSSNQEVKKIEKTAKGGGEVVTKANPENCLILFKRYFSISIVGSLEYYTKFVGL